jgi:hypothetical protein
VVAVAAEPNAKEHARRGKRAGTGQKQQRKQFRFHNSSLDSLGSAAISERLTH